MNATGKSSSRQDNVKSDYKNGVHLSGSVANNQTPKNNDTFIKQLQTSNHKSQLTAPLQMPINNQHQYPQFVYQNIQNQYFHHLPIHGLSFSNNHIPNNKPTTSYSQPINFNQNYQS